MSSLLFKYFRSGSRVPKAFGTTRAWTSLIRVCFLGSRAVVLREVVSLILVCLTYSLTAQNHSAASDFKKLNEKLYKRRYDFTLTYQLYETYTAPLPIETQLFDVKMWDLMVNIKNKQFHVIRNKENYLYVDFSRKVMMLNSVKKYGAELKQLKEIDGMINLDTLLDAYEKIVELEAKNGFKTYRFYLPAHVKYAYTDVTINTAQMQLHKIVMFYRLNMDELNGKRAKNNTTADKLPRMEMLFSNYRFPKTLEATQFSISNYVNKEGKNVKPVAPYTRYKLIDNTF